MVRDDARRTLLYDLNRATMQVSQSMPESPAAIMLTARYHNLVRMWSDV